MGLANCASSSESYARRINCTMSEFSSPQMRCMKFAAKYTTMEFVVEVLQRFFVAIMPF